MSRAQTFFTEMRAQNLERELARMKRESMRRWALMWRKFARLGLAAEASLALEMAQLHRDAMRPS
jgi:hypothetical protein